MVTATKEIKIFPVTKLEEREVVTLEISKEQAETLVIICELIGGCRETSRRKHTEEISKALICCGVKAPVDWRRNISWGSPDVIRFLGERGI